jgi:hypothetical protein
MVLPYLERNSAVSRFLSFSHDPASQVHNVCMLALLLLWLAPVHPQKTPPPQPSSKWTLVWNDEFSGSNGSPPERSQWVIETGGNGWGNHELEYYTNRVQNVQLLDGNLVITARIEGARLHVRTYQDAKEICAGLRAF